MVHKEGVQDLVFQSCIVVPQGRTMHPTLLSAVWASFQGIHGDSNSVGLRVGGMHWNKVVVPSRVSKRTRIALACSGKEVLQTHGRWVGRTVFM